MKNPILTVDSILDFLQGEKYTKEYLQELFGDKREALLSEALRTEYLSYDEKHWLIYRLNYGIYEHRVHILWMIEQCQSLFSIFQEANPDNKLIKSCLDASISSLDTAIIYVFSVYGTVAEYSSNRKTMEQERMLLLANLLEN